MAAEYRCEHCGRMVPFAPGQRGKATCPHCHKTVFVSAWLREFPRPQTPSGAPARQAIPVRARAAEPPSAHASDRAAAAVLARAMPWIISVFFHVGLALVMVFALAFLIPEKAARTVPEPGVYARLSRDVPVLRPRLTWPVRSGSARPAGRLMRDDRPAAPRGRPSENKTPRMRILGLARRNGRVALDGLDGLGWGRRFFDTSIDDGPGPRGGGKADVVYVIDGSGSMVDRFDTVRYELFRSIGSLASRARFHVILFAEGPLCEKVPRRLTHATRANKLGVVPFLSDYRPCGMTNPMPALARAFEVLRRDGRKTPKLILLLTDGVFPDNERVLELIRRNNGKRSVVIHTFLYGRSSTAAEAVLQKIARENGGRYECIRLDE